MHPVQATVTAAARHIVGDDDLFPEAATIVTCRALTLIPSSNSNSNSPSSIVDTERRNILAQYASWREDPTTITITSPHNEQHATNALTMLQRVSAAVDFFTDCYIDDATRWKRNFETGEEIRRALFRVQVYNELFRVPPGLDEEEMLFLGLFSTEEVEVIGCVCEFLFRYFSPVFNEIANINDFWALQGVIPSDFWPGRIWENPWLRQIIANGLPLLHAVTQAHSQECRSAILTSRLGMRRSYLLDRIIGVLPYLLSSENDDEDDGKIWNRFQMGWATVIRRRENVLSKKQRNIVPEREENDDGKKSEVMEVFTVMPMLKCKASVVSI